MTATVGVVRETADDEHRVALTPDGVHRVSALGVAVVVETAAGRDAGFGDADYAAAGAAIGSRDQVYATSDVVVCVHPPVDADVLHEGQWLIGLLAPLTAPELAERMADAKVTMISLDLLPRTLSRAQAMDALTSQATVAGYKAALIAANTYGGFFPMLMTAAGTTRPAEVLVLGAGVAGLQAIATARRLGAVVTAHDVREAAQADIASTGAAVLALGPPSGAGDGGYARALTEAEARVQQEALDAAIGRFDVVITTAQVPGGRPPRLVSEHALAGMRPGSVVVDLAAGPFGGNVAGSRPGRSVVTAEGVTVVGAGDLAATMPRAASTAYSRNLAALLRSLIPDGTPVVDLGDEIVAGVLVTHRSEVVHPGVRAALDQRKEVRS